MYRALTWLALHEGVALDDGPALEALAAAHPVAFGGNGAVSIAGEDVTARIHDGDRRRRAGRRTASRGARGDARRQRELGRSGDSVIEGRDIGVIVVPEAEVKIWLVADPAVRARRRHAEQDGLRMDQLRGAPPP